MNSKTMLPINLGLIHFIGIGGIGMSGIAEVLFNLGYKVKGSDGKDSTITQRLKNLGIKISIGHAEANIEGVEVVVISSAIGPKNPELHLARKLGIPIVKRAEMLAELMRLKSNIAVAGSHGKTTTTSMVAALLDGGDFDPTVINGGVIQAYGSNARVGEGDWMVVEADESDGTFTKLPATVAVVTNIDPEHLEHYGSFERLVEAFHHFVTNTPFYGAIICCTDDPDVHRLVGRISDRKVIKYGFNNQADYRISGLQFENGTAHFELVLGRKNSTVRDFILPMTGEHNALNALGALVVAHHLGIPLEVIKKSLRNFKGVKRRFTHVDIISGVTIIDDYAHHPVEIEAVLKAARQATKGRVLAVHQPHRYSRLSLLFDDFCRCFNEADIVAITDIYGANEIPIEGVSQTALVEGLNLHGHRDVYAIHGELGLKEFFKEKTQSNDIFVCLGAGSISSWVNNLPSHLAKDGY